MFVHGKLTLLLLFTFTLPSVLLTAANENVQLNNPSGVSVTGDKIIERSLGKQIARFRGIPYAQAPVGELRFRKPVPWTWKTTKEIDATRWPSQCTQMKSPHKEVEAYLVEHSPNTTEDCLYLNVWSPELDTKTLRPVLVWIHGGGLYFGSSSFELYNFETLASRADAVVVSMNYRFVFV